MNYGEFIERALHGRSVNAAAKEMGIAQPVLNRYKLGQNLPGPLATIILAHEAGISEGEALRVLATEEASRKGLIERLKQLFKPARRAMNLSFA